MSEAKVRVTAGMKTAVLEVLSRAGTFTDPKIFAEELALAVITAEDAKIKYVVGTRNALNEVYIFGPYANPEAALKAMDTGLLATTPGTKGGVFPLIAAPKLNKQTKPKT